MALGEAWALFDSGTWVEFPFLYHGSGSGVVLFIDWSGQARLEGLSLGESEGHCRYFG